MGEAGSGWSEDPAPLLRVGAGFRLSETDPDETPGFDGKKSDGERELAIAAGAVDTLQEKLFASSLFDRDGDQHRSLLLVLQGMDSSGKGGIVRHVVGSVDPQGVTHASFKRPTKLELSHDFLWRIRKRVPEPGKIGVFDRSHYEDVLAVKVLGLASLEEVDGRYGTINDFEHELVEQGTTVVKVFLNISPDEQKARLGARLERADKYWKYNPGDIDSRLLWNQYQDAYQTVFERTSTEAAPWFVVPANPRQPAGCAPISPSPTSSISSGPPAA
nr:PPK2 family polyphosphate kinase [Subtercola boreus]